MAITIPEEGGIEHRTAKSEVPLVDHTRWLKFFALNGYVFVAVIGVGWSIVPGIQPWSPAMSAVETAQYFADHRTQLLIAAGAWQVGMLAMLLWQVAMAAHLWRIEGGIRLLTITGFVSGLTVPFLMMIAGASLAVAAYRPLEEPGVTRGFADFFYWIADAYWPVVSAEMFFVGWLLMRSQGRRNAFPRYTVWLSWLAAATMPLLWGGFFSDSGVLAANGLVGYFIPMGTWALWTLGLTPPLHRHLSSPEWIAWLRAAR
jgi:hypothetical protein